MLPVIYGQVPHVSGVPLAGLVCEDFVLNGVRQSTANVVFVKLRERWHRFAVDPPTVHWRVQHEPPTPWSVAEENWDYPHRDVGTEFGLLGLRILEIEMMQIGETTRVCLRFEDGRAFVVVATHTETNWYLQSRLSDY